MTPAAIRSIIRKLTVLAADEARVLKERNLAAVAALGGAKEKLATQLEGALPEGVGHVDKALLRDLAKLHDLSMRNAAQISALRDGVVRANARLQEMNAAAVTPGVYGERGAKLRLPRLATRDRNA